MSEFSDYTDDEMRTDYHLYKKIQAEIVQRKEELTTLEEKYGSYNLTADIERQVGLRNL